ncbi:MAG: hypothetical protein JXB32_08680 [Deltaproteobacteria bacterium]|nr:hypothetical protein [Deltaproteobacteria bacterium]
MTCEDPYESAIPIYVTTGQVAAGGEVVPLAEATYDHGGNHHNDSLLFSHGGRSFQAYHSSFGFGWRCCQPMDCLQLLDAAGTVLEDGCTCDRSIPAVCVQVRPDGTWTALVDTFAVCAGDNDCG